MARPRNLNPSEKIHVSIPGDLALRLQIFLTSPATGKVPAGAYQAFWTARLQEFFDKVEREQAVVRDFLQTEG